ncbi:MAG: LolA-related protein [Rubrivivax sp.]|nr:LolA-related protein [Rubrivivax sp.]
MRRAALLMPLLPLLLGGGLGTAPAWAAFELDTLMALLAQRSSGEARFTEERTVSTLDSTLQSSGRLSFRAPDQFARYTEEPRPESMEVQGNNVVLRRGTRTRTMALDAIPELAALADAMRGTLGGNAQVLRRHFTTSVSGGPAKWVLSLKPIDAALARSVRQIEIAGTRSDVRSVELQLTGGDRSLMLVTPLLTPPATPPATLPATPPVPPLATAPAPPPAPRPAR